MFRSWLALFSFLGGCILTFALIVAWVRYGYISGTEFCPHSFRTRDFYYWQPLFFSSGMFKVETENDPFSIALDLTGAVPPLPHVRWDLVEDNYTSSLDRDTEAKLLTDIIMRSSGSEFAWIEWTVEHPELGARLWPWIRRLAIDRFYVVTPELFFLANSSGDLAPDDFEERLKHTIQLELRRMLAEAEAADRLPDQERIRNALDEYGLTDDLPGQ